MKLSSIIVTHNSIKYLPYFLDSLFTQTYFKSISASPDIFIVDNASIDKTVKFIRDNYPTVHLLRNINNIGLARAWNQAIQMTRGEYVFIMNPDLVLDKNYLKECLSLLEQDQTLASVGGKLYQLNLVIQDGEIINLEKTNILDSCGLVASQSGRFLDRGAGQIDRGQYNQTEQVFGLSGAAVVYRRYALEQVKFKNQYFDDDFFIYKEDIDLAWRLRLAGWRAVYVPRAVAYHHRRARSLSDSNFKKIINYRRYKENFVNFYSYRNHLIMLIKNLYFENFIFYFFSLFWYELKKFVYMLILENSNLRRALYDIIRLRKIIKSKRDFNRRIRRTSPHEIRQWFK